MLTLAKAQADLAEAEDIEGKEGNVEDLPFEDESFDTVLSRFGHMFSPKPEIAIREMLRVTKSGGRVAFATWQPEHANGKMFVVITKHTFPPFSSHSPDTPTPPFSNAMGNPRGCEK